MRQVITAFVAMTWLALLALEPSDAQQPKPVSVGFRNNTNTNVIVQGFTIVKGQRRFGPFVPVAAKTRQFELHVPYGVRYYTIYDTNQPPRVLLREYPVAVQGQDLLFAIEVSRMDPQRFVLVPLPLP